MFLIKATHRLLTSYLPTSSHIKTKANDFYHKSIYKLLLPYFIKAYNLSLNSKHKPSNNIHINSRPIWIFWWQGLNHMPIIVKKCIQSIKRNANGNKVILLNKNNLKHYVKLPNYIYNKINKGDITLTHFSDILRANLITNYGGLWIDSTMYCTSKITNNYFNNIYTSGGYPNKLHQYVSSKWTGFLIGGKKQILLFTFIDNFFKIYWKNNTYMYDYFLLDYALMFIYRHNINNFKTYTNKISYLNNPHLYSLAKVLNKPYNDNLYKHITKDTNLFKLTYKKKFNDNGNTFYHKLLQNQL